MKVFVRELKVRGSADRKGPTEKNSGERGPRKFEGYQNKRKKETTKSGKKGGKATLIKRKWETNPKKAL